MTYRDYSKYDIVFVAALAGASDSEKCAIFKYIKKHAKPKTHIIARSSHGKRKRLYAPLPEKVYTLFDPIFEISPYNEIINSVVIFKI